MELGLGCSLLGELSPREVRSIVDTALEHGARTFDTANVYGSGRSESLLGEALAGVDGVRVATKFGYGPEPVGANEGGSPEVARRALEASLERLRRPRIENWFLHGPDPRTPLATTLQAMGKAREEGLVGSIGVCNARPEWLACGHSEIGGWNIEALQVEVNVVNRQALRWVHEVAREARVEIWGTGVLRRGTLAMPEAGLLPRHWVDPMLECSRRLGVSPAMVSIAWAVHVGRLSCLLVGTQRPRHLAEAARAISLARDPLAIEVFRDVLGLSDCHPRSA